MRNKPRHSSRARSAFSLLEVLLAITIFSICLIALYSTFRVSTRAFEAGRKSAEVIQTMRFTVDRVSRDLRGVMYETSYRARLKALNYDAWAREDQMALASDLDDQSLLRGVYMTSDDEDAESFGGQMLNLGFKGTDGGAADQVEFARRLGSDGSFDDSYLGAERIRYYLEGSDLYRQRERVANVIRINANWRDELAESKQLRDEERDAAERDPNEELIDFRALARRGTLPEQFEPENTVSYFTAEPAEICAPELLAHNVTQFNLTYGYLEGQWAEADEWDSDRKKFRSPPFSLTASDPNFQSMLADYQARPDDGVPSFVRLTITVDPRAAETATEVAPDPAGEARKVARSRRRRGRARTIQTIVWIPSSVEGYLPEDFGGKYEPTVEED